MEEILYYNALYDCYKSLFTEKQQSYFEGYYFYNLSFGEIAENEGVSRNAVYKQVKDVCERLKDYEGKLHLLEIKQELENWKEWVEDDKLKQKCSCLLEKIGDETGR